MSVKANGRIRSRWTRMAGGAVFTSLTWITSGGAVSAAPVHPAQAQMSKLALDAYCAEAVKESQPFAAGQISYKTVVEKAGERAVEEHPEISKNPTAWKTKIVSVLDQFGDEPTTQLCREDPSKPHS